MEVGFSEPDHLPMYVQYRVNMVGFALGPIIYAAIVIVVANH